MGAYTYVAIDETGKREAGQVNAADVAAARDVLRQKGLVALELNAEAEAQEKGGRTFNLFAKKVKPQALQVFSRQMATMIQAGVNIVTALSVLAEQTEDQHFADIIRNLRSDVEDGALLSQAMSRHSDTFSRMYISMVEAGEASGALDLVLDRVAYQIEKQNQLRRRVKGAMTYPLVVLAFAVLVLTGLLIFLVPVFEDIFADLGGDLPLLTQFTVGASDAIRGYWFIIFPAIYAVFWAFRRYLKTEDGRRRWHKFGLGAPMGVGPIVAKVAIARFSRTLATLVSSGVDIIRALGDRWADLRQRPGRGSLHRGARASPRRRAFGDADASSCRFPADGVPHDRSG